MTLNDWYLFAQGLAAISLFLTFVSGAAVIALGLLRDKREETTRLEMEDRIAAARERAASAEEGTARARADAAAANERAARASEAAAEASERTVRVEAEAARQQERAAVAERQLLELQERIAPRRFTATERAALITSLSAANPKGLVTLSAVIGDAEGLTFANHVAEILRASGWQTAPIGIAGYAGRNPVGFDIAVRSAAQAPPHAAVLQRAFERAGIELPGGEDPTLDADTVRLVIGNKPQQGH